MSDALYAPNGFYRSAGTPARHFRTAAHVGGPWVAAIHELALRVHAVLGGPAGFTIVDVGAGGGELLAGLANRVPDEWSLIGVDLAPRPAALPDRVGWRDRPPSGVNGLVLAVELLDVVPVEVVEVTESGPRLVEVSRDGDERLGAAPTAVDLDWLQRCRPDRRAGDRIEIGGPRDEVWGELIASLVAGIAVVVDYAINEPAHRGGTLTGFRDGQPVPAIPDGSCDLTAHVQFEPLRRAGDLLTSQRDALRRLEVTADRPRYDGDPASYLASLSAAGDTAELMSASGLGGFTWLVHGVGVDPESVLRQSKRAARTAAHTSSRHR